MKTVRRSALTDEYVRVQVSAKNAGAPINVTTDTVELAVIADTPGNEPGGGDWKTAGWETDSTTTPATYYARALPSTIFGHAAPFTSGSYAVWVRVHDNPELVAEPVYRLVIF